MQIPTNSTNSATQSLKGFGYAVRIALIASLGGFLFGFETAVISGAEKIIQQLWDLDSFWQGFTVASSLIGTVIGSLVAGKPAQKFGRKKVLTIIALMYIVSAIGCAITSSWILFITFRMIGGLAVGASSVVGPMYISEVSPARIRGRLAGSFQVNIVLGILIAYLTNYILAGVGEESWRYMFGIMLVPASLFAILLRSFPESPRWLLLNNRIDEAERVFLKVGEGDVKDYALNADDASVKPDSLFQKKYSKPVFFAVMLAMFNQLSGINAIIYYAPRIFEMAGYDTSNAFMQSVFIGLANLCFTLLAMSVIDKFGRKKLLLIGSVGMIVFLFLTAAAFYDPSQSSPMVIYYLIGFIAFFAFSQGAVIWVFIAEIFPNSVRSQGGSLGSFTHWIMAAIISWTFPMIVEGSNMGGFYSFAFYCAMMVLHLVFVWKFLPETKGKSLEQIQSDLKIH